MALGTPTVGTKRGVQASSPSKKARITFLGDGTYPAGGTAAFAAYVAAALGLASVTIVNVTCLQAGVYLAQWDATNDKLIMRNISDGADATPGDLSGTTVDLVVEWE